MRASLIRRLERLESARSRHGVYRLAWQEHDTIVPQSPQSVPTASGATVCQRRIPYNRYESQRKFDELACTFKGFSGPVGSGKSKALCHEVIKCCYLNPGVPGLLGAPTEKLLASSTLIELLSILDQHGIPYRYRKSDNQIRLLEPDATILLRSLDNPERLRAMNLGWFGIDELTYCKEDAWLRLEGRIRHPQARYRRGFAVWTPKGKDWVWRRFISARKIEHYEAVEAKPFENQAVLSAAPDYYTNLKHSYDEKFYRQEVLGEYLDLYSGTVYHAFSSDNVRECTFNPSLPLIVSMDFNVNPMSGVILQVEELLGYATVRVLREIVLPDSHVEPWCKRLIDTVQPWARSFSRNRQPLEISFYGDANGGARSPSSSGNTPWDVVESFMQQEPEYHAHMMYKKQNPDVLDRINVMNGMLCKADGPTRRLFIDPSCTELITDLEEVKWKVDAHGVTLPDIDNRNPKRTHVSDALGYYVETEHGSGSNKVRFSKFSI